MAEREPQSKPEYLEPKKIIRGTVLKFVPGVPVDFSPDERKSLPNHIAWLEKVRDAQQPRPPRQQRAK